MAETHKKKFRGIQHKALAIALGVNRLAHRRHVEIEAGVHPIDLREKIKIFKTFNKIKDSTEHKLIKKRINQNKCSNFTDKVMRLKNEYGDIETKTIKEFKNEVDKKWVKAVVVKLFVLATH